MIIICRWLTVNRTLIFRSALQDFVCWIWFGLWFSSHNDSNMYTHSLILTILKKKRISLFSFIQTVIFFLLNNTFIYFFFFKFLFQIWFLSISKLLFFLFFRFYICFCFNLARRDGCWDFRQPVGTESIGGTSLGRSRGIWRLNVSNWALHWYH